jgi:hypothetical protein
MRDFLLTLLHLAVMAAKLCGPGGVRAVIAENLLLKQQLIVLRRARQRAPNLLGSDRLLCGFWSLFLSPGRIRKVAVALRPSTLLAFHQALVRRKYRRLFSSTPEPDDQATSPLGDARTLLPLEPAAAIDLARTGVYARILAATARISEQPQLAELVLAASATIGPRYTARLFERATAEHVSPPLEALDALTFEVDPRTRGSEQVEAGFCFRGRRLSAEPWFPVPWPILDPPDVAQVTREARDAEYEGLPDARPGEAFHWHAYPPDQEAYEAFVRYALRHAARSHASLNGRTPLTFAEGQAVASTDLSRVRWVSHCHDLVQLPVAA